MCGEYVWTGMKRFNSDSPPALSRMKFSIDDEGIKCFYFNFLGYQKLLLHAITVNQQKMEE